MYYSTTYSSPVGLLTLACNDDSLIGLWIKGQKYHGESIFQSFTTKNNTPIFNKTKIWLDKYFSKQMP
ncbi:MAG: cysteine methyltransferase, partial [Oscillospiraceae bacterium]